MTLATATASGIPSARIVLLKSVDDRGFVFYTNYNSRKGSELEANPHAALILFWAEVSRQIRIEGTVTRVSPEESDVYFATRPRDGQLSSVASSQSKPIGSRKELDQRFEELNRLNEGKPISRPSHWGGYRVLPTTIEFWQSRFARLNDRVAYTRSRENQWIKTRLQP
jgi:pyridoxamine 5'-phosphate oxidase